MFARTPSYSATRSEEYSSPLASTVCISHSYNAIAFLHLPPIASIEQLNPFPSNNIMAFGIVLRIGGSIFITVH